MDKSAIYALRDIYETQISAVTDATIQARARLALSVWVKAEIQYQEILEASATSYSTSGRTITKRDIDAATAARNTARTELEGEIGGPNAGVTYVDNGGRIW